MILVENMSLSILTHSFGNGGHVLLRFRNLLSEFRLALRELVVNGGLQLFSLLLALVDLGQVAIRHLPGVRLDEAPHLCYV